MPCPVDRRQFADSAEGPRRRRKRNPDDADEGEVVEGQSGKKERECPVPKPGGLVGQMMGFDHQEKEKAVPVVVKSLRTRERNGQRAEGNEIE